jgi:hypothetical protein
MRSGLLSIVAGDINFWGPGIELPGELCIRGLGFSWLG